MKISQSRIFAAALVVACFIIVYASEGTAYQAEVSIESCQVLSGENTKYLLTKDIFIPEDKCIEITGNNSVFDCQGYEIQAFEGFRGWLIYGAGRGITVRNCTICGPRDGAYDSSIGILFNTVSNGLIENNQVDGFGTGILAMKGDNNIIQNNVVENSIKALGVSQGSDNNIIKDNTVRDNDRQEGWGLSVWKSRGNRFINNKSHGNNFGIVLSSADKTYIECDSYTDNEANIKIYNGCKDVILAGVDDKEIDLSEDSSYMIEKVECSGGKIEKFSGLPFGFGGR